jgi:hypothetical protein
MKEAGAHHAIIPPLSPHFQTTSSNRTVPAATSKFKHYDTLYTYQLSVN